MNDIGGVRRAFYAGLDMGDLVVAPFADGCAAVCTQRAPDKETANEDSAALISWEPSSGILAIADGAGGSRAGGEASRLALESIAECVAGAAKDETSVRDAILTGIEEANERIMAMGVGAATTLALVELEGRTIRTYHVGDSMILVVGQRGRVKLQTVSHSPVGYAVESGMMDAGEAMDHEERHLVSNFVGTPDMRVEIGSLLELAPHDTVVVASDGLFDNLHIEEIVEYIRCGGLPRAFHALFGEARRRMTVPEPGSPSKPDDLTAVVFRPRCPAGVRGS